MIITYYGHSCFKLRGGEGTVITDPFSEYVGFEFPNLSADVVTVSNDSPAHNNAQAVSETARRDKPFIIDHPGEYEIEGISVFGVKAFHDDQQGSELGSNIIYTFLLDNLRVCHLGALGHELSEEHVTEIGLVDVLFVPVGGLRTLDPKTAIKVTRSLEPNVVIPMLYQTPLHNDKVFADLQPLEDFLKEYEAEPETVDKLNIDRGSLPEEMELVVMERI